MTTKQDTKQVLSAEEIIERYDLPLALEILAEIGITDYPEIEKEAWEMVANETASPIVRKSAVFEAINKSHKPFNTYINFLINGSDEITDICLNLTNAVIDIFETFDQLIKVLGFIKELDKDKYIDLKKAYNQLIDEALTKIVIIPSVIELFEVLNLGLIIKLDTYNKLAIKLSTLINDEDILGDMPGNNAGSGIIDISKWISNRIVDITPYDNPLRDLFSEITGNLLSLAFKIYLDKNLYFAQGNQYEFSLDTLTIAAAKSCTSYEELDELDQFVNTTLNDKIIEPETDRVIVDLKIEFSQDPQILKDLYYQAATNNEQKIKIYRKLAKLTSQ